MTERKPRVRKPEPEADNVELFIAALRKYNGIRVQAEGPYKAIDRYRDFATVFGSEAGQRVLAQIVDHADRRVSEKDVGDHAKLAWILSQRELATWIAATATVPPREQ